MKKIILATYTLSLPFQLKFPTIPVLSVVNMYLIALIILLLISEKGKFTRLSKPSFNMPLALFWTMFTFAVINGCIQVISLMGIPVTELVTEYKRLITLVLGYYVFAYCVTTKEELKLMINVFVLSIILVGVQTLRTGVLGGANFGDHKRAFGPFGVDFYASDIAGGFLATFMPFVMAYCLFEKNRLYKIASAVGMGILAMALFATYARGALLAFVLAAFYLYVVTLPEMMKRSKLYSIFTIILLLGLLASWRVWVPESIVTRTTKTLVSSDPDEGGASTEKFLQNEKAYENFGGSIDTSQLPEGFGALDESSQLRIIRWTSMMNLIKESPIFGVGFRQTLYLYSVDAHNSFLQIAGEMGILTLLVFLWLLWCIYREAWKLLKTDYANIAAGFVGGIPAFFLVNNFYSNFFRNTVTGTLWIALGLLAAAKRLHYEEQNRVTKVEEPKAPQRRKVRKRKYYILIFALIIGQHTGTIVAAESNRWWNPEEVETLNVYKDLQQGVGTIYYVDVSKGNDKNLGNSWLQPFKSIGRAVQNLNAGDTVVIKPGVYKERITISAQGLPENRILIGPAGKGEVIIDASMPIGPWEEFSAGVYKARCEKKPRSIVVDEVPIFPEFTLDAVQESRWFYDEAEKTLYMKVVGGDSPDNHEIGIFEDGKYGHAVFLHNSQNVTLYGLTIKYAPGKGVEILGAHNRVEKCKIMFNGSTGIGVFSHEDIRTFDSHFIKNYIYHNYLRNWPRGRYKNGGWGSGIGGNTSERNVIRGNIVTKTGGEGINATGHYDIIEENISYDNWSVNFYVDNRHDVTINRNFSYCTDPDPNELYNNGDPTPEDGKNLRRLRADGIMTADEYKVAEAENIRITNNVVIGCRRGFNHYPLGEGSGLKNFLIANNTFIVPNRNSEVENYTGIRIPYNNGNNVNTVFRNNIVYGTHPDTLLLSVQTSLVGTGDPFKGIMLDHNIFYHIKGSRKAFHVGPRWSQFSRIDYYQIEKRKTAVPWFIQNQFIDPKFENPNRLVTDAAKLQADSPAILKGLNIAGIVKDYFGTNRPSEGVTIGAYEPSAN